MQFSTSVMFVYLEVWRGVIDCFLYFFVFLLSVFGSLLSCKAGLKYTYVPSWIVSVLVLYTHLYLYFICMYVYARACVCVVHFYGA